MKKSQHSNWSQEQTPSAEPEPTIVLGSFMTVEDVADMLRINKSTVYRMAKAGRIPATRVGRQWRFRLSALEEFLDAGGDSAYADVHEEEPLRKVVNRW